MAQYDEIIKHLMDRFAVEFAALSFGTTDVQVLETLDTEHRRTLCKNLHFMIS